MAEFDWYGDGGPVGGYGNNTSGGGGDDSGGGSDYVAIAGFAGTGTEMADKCEFSEEVLNDSHFTRIRVPMANEALLPSLVGEGCVVSINTTTNVTNNGEVTGQVTKNATAKLEADQHIYWLTTVGASFNAQPFYYGYVKENEGFYITVPAVPMGTGAEAMKEYLRENVLYVQIAVLPASVADVIASAVRVDLNH